MIRKYDYRKAKGNRYYTIKSLAKVYEVHPATVRAWIKNHNLSCAIVDDVRPVLMKGSLVRTWMKEWQDNRGWVCGPGEVSCLTCNGPRRMKPHSFEIETGNTDKITVTGACDECGGRLRGLDVAANIPSLKAEFGQNSHEH